MLRTVFNKEQQERKDTLNVEDAEISGAAHSFGICDHREKGPQNENVNLVIGALILRGADMLLVLTSDYHVPRSHQPKND